MQAYQALNPLTEAELRALWPLVLNRAAVLVLSSEQQLTVDPGNQYTRDNIAHEWEIFDTATAVPFALMEAAILQAAGLQPAAPDWNDCAPCSPSWPGWLSHGWTWEYSANTSRPATGSNPVTTSIC